MFKRKVAANLKQYDHQREKGMSTFYHRLPRSENYKENPNNSTLMVWRSNEEALKEAEKLNERIPPEIKIISSNIEGPTRQRVNPVLTEEKESAM